MSEYVEWSDGSKYWYQNGQLHREDGPAIDYNNGELSWYRDGELHREDGPAVDHLYVKIWCKFGKYHREDGPAIEYDDGDVQYCEYWVEGVRINENEYFVKFGVVNE